MIIDRIDNNNNMMMMMMMMIALFLAKMFSML